jgi:hypothetical protein
MDALNEGGYKSLQGKRIRVNHSVRMRALSAKNHLEVKFEVAQGRLGPMLYRGEKEGGLKFRVRGPTLKAEARFGALLSLQHR